ncbi:MAG: uroporphyrinogen decarboxylase family protein [Lachnospiraceae bacterium]|nr:uroporphyrinogen decarboxylase family protein [Lachnospiraceae bacterium]MDD3616384.1 uroporphyrinogen decarboxylase family protein [Lachnospiraceae bacterium]
MTAKELFLETIKQDGKPERLLKQFEGTVFYPPSPVASYIRGNRHRGMEPLVDRFGTTILWPEGQVAAMPHVTAENKVIKDITNWKEELVMPDLEANCSDSALWEPFIKQAEEFRAEGKLVMGFMPTGVFERLHFLMGFEDMLLNYLLEPEAMMELCEAIGEYRYQYMKMIVDNIKPDIMLTHDDWGAKHAMFTSPDTWREFIKPQYAKTYKYMKDHDVIIMHHADSFLEPIIEDMVELGIDIWQGVLPENDIPKLQKQLNGRMTLMGGIDASIVDRADATEEEIRTEVKRACEAYGPGGHFIPCITYGGPGCLFPHVDPIIDDEIDKYNQK